MPLTPGTRLGPYAITAQIGVGGMGEVYRATDTKLKRDVAVKVLPSHVAADPERLARFQREAEVLASLNHPNIAAIYGLEEADQTKALVMELVEGPTLADRIAQGAIPVDEALPVAKQIAEALEAAHEQGIIHRDLKPANIKLRPDGVVKVLDFGLAKALEPTGAMSPGMSQAPTITTPAMTQAGMILGTAAYMSPEQAKGKTVDKRSDIWAFGAVLYEMLSGQRVFPGGDTSEVLAGVIKSEPDWDVVPLDTPPLLLMFLKQCLKKDPKQRVPDIAAMRLALEGAFETGVPQAVDSAVVVQPAVWRRPVPFALAASLLTAVVVGLVGWSLLPSAEPPSVNRFDYDLPEGQEFRGLSRSVMALSPDGRHFVYNTTQGLYLRSMGDLEARLIPGTEGNLVSPFFSPDGESVGYLQQGRELKRIAISGGAPVVIATGIQIPLGASWGPDGMILFGQTEGILRVSANGGTPELVIPAGAGEALSGPQLLRDGDSVLFSATTATGVTRWDQAQIVVQSLGTGERTVVLQGGSDARYLPTGHLVYALGDGLFAVAFDADRLEVQGGPVSLVEGVMRAGFSDAANYGVSDQGSLVYVIGTAAGNELVWVDREGNVEPMGAPAGAYNVSVRLSPDGQRVAIEDADVRLFDIARQTLPRLTFEGGALPMWTPDGQHVTYRSEGDPWNLFQRRADGSGSEEQLTTGDFQQLPAPGPPTASFWPSIRVPVSEVTTTATSGSCRWRATGSRGPSSPHRSVRPRQCFLPMATGSPIGQMSLAATKSMCSRFPVLGPSGRFRPKAEGRTSGHETAGSCST